MITRCIAPVESAGRWLKLGDAREMADAESGAPPESGGGGQAAGAAAAPAGADRAPANVGARSTARPYAARPSGSSISEYRTITPDHCSLRERSIADSQEYASRSAAADRIVATGSGRDVAR